MSRNNRMSPITADPNGTKFSGGGQASRLLFSLQEGSRDGRPTSQTALNHSPPTPLRSCKASRL